MTFVEDFPSLNNKFHVGLLAKKYISECCLDKPKVKDAILKTDMPETEKCFLLKELGLDK